MTQSATEYLSIVQRAAAEGLGLELEEVTSDATLLGDLGAESIDLLDVLFRVERESGVKITADDIADRLQGGIDDDVFSDDDDIIQDAGLTHLETVLPQFDRADLTGPLTAEDVLTLFTVQNLADLLGERSRAADVAV